MAVDTAAKRFSMMSFGQIGVLIPPDGTIDAGDRSTFMSLYSGIALDAPPSVIPLRNIRRKAIKPRMRRTV